MSDEKEPIVIELGDSGLIAWISPEDEELTKFSWLLKTAGSKEFPHYYAHRRWKMGSLRGEYWLHNSVWELMFNADLPKGFLVDHINGDKLDNRRENLRLATRMDNEANKRKRRTQSGGAPSSQYKGVTEVKDGRKKKWRATITVEHRQIKLGAYYTEVEGAEAYNDAAKHYFGEFAFLNEIEKEKNDV
jgi:hypothetical protein